jgi:hypothetical protein
VPKAVAISLSAVLISTQLCLASDTSREAAEAWWSIYGETAKAELRRLPDAGRKAFQNALVACSLYADDYHSQAHRAECQRAEKSFIIEFSRNSSAIDFWFKNSIINTEILSANVALEIEHGKRPDVSGGDARYLGSMFFKERTARRERANEE